MAKETARKRGYKKRYPQDRMLAETKRLLRQLGLQARKGLGQHFLVDEGVLERIVDAAELGPTDVVLEIGPGLGVLTRELAGKAGWVVAVELDTRLALVLKKELASFNNVAIVNQDILKTSPASLREGLPPDFPGIGDGRLGYKVVANLPYYITSAVLRHLLETQFKPKVMVVMVQKEVAEAIVAQPGDMSLLAISVQFYGRPDIISYVPANSFYPAPEVDSAILKIELYPQPPVSVRQPVATVRRLPR